MVDYKKILVWQRAHGMTIVVYRATQGFPPEERYGLTSQLRRAAASVPTNIVEGCGRSSHKDLARFLDIAAGSASETEYLLLLCHELAYIDEEQEYKKLSDEYAQIKKMLHAYRKKVLAIT